MIKCCFKNRAPSPWSYKSALCGNGLTLFQTTNFRLLQTERICRGQLKFDENGRRVSKWVENTAGKGEIAHNEQFLLFS